MALTPIKNFCGGSYPSRARGVSYARTVNMRVERNEDPGSKSPATLFPRAGKKLFATLPTSPNQGCWANKTRAFFVSGGHFYEVMEDGVTFVDFGIIDIGSNPATIRANVNQVMVCSAGKAYVATGTTLFQPIINFASGTVSITGNALTWVSGDKFQPAGGGAITPGDTIQFVDGRNFVVLAVADDTHLTVAGLPGDVAEIRYAAGNEFLTGATLEFIDGYFIVNTPNTKQFRISNLEDGTKWDDADQAQKSGSLDNIATVYDIGGQLALIGDNNSSEVWGDSGNVDFPFEPIQGRSISMGTAAPWSVAKLPDGSLCWLMSSTAGEGMIVRSSGGEPDRISHHALEYAISTYGKISDAVGRTYLSEGHPAYRIDFISANRSWEWDDDAKAWTEVGIATDKDEEFASDPGRFGLHVTWPTSGAPMDLVADAYSGKVWQVSNDFLDDDGVDIPLLKISPHVNTSLLRATCTEFRLDCELGTVDPTAKGADGKPLIPMVELFCSFDGARNWKRLGAASLGRTGEYEGTLLDDAEKFDAAPNSQTNPQVWESSPRWNQPGSFWIGMTIKFKSTARELRAVYNGLADFNV